MLRAVLERDVPILWMTFEKLRLGFEGVGHALVGVDVPLRTVHDADEAQFERIHTSREYVKRVRASIHQVQLGEDADRPPALWIDGSREIEGVGVGEVYVCGGDRENDAIVRVQCAYGYVCECVRTWGGGFQCVRVIDKGVGNLRTSWVLRCTRGRDYGFVFLYHSADRRLESSQQKRR